MAGKLRRAEVTVSAHTPPKFYLVPELLSGFCQNLNTRFQHLPKINETNGLENLVSFLAWAQHRFLWIHPFQDYNGRIARLLTNILLINLDLPPIELKIETKTTRQGYIKALQAADNNKFDQLEKLIESALQESINDTGKTKSQE